MVKKLFIITTFLLALITSPKIIESPVGNGFTKPTGQTELESRRDENDKPGSWKAGAGEPTGTPYPSKELELVPKTKDSSESPSRFLIEPKTNNDRGIELELTDEMKQNLEFFNDSRFKLD